MELSKMLSKTVRRECLYPELGQCWIWTGRKNGGGYGTVKIKQKIHLAHREAYRLQVGNIPDGLWVLHKCDAPGCLNPDHLFLGTNLDNTLDKTRKGRVNTPVGERNGSAKLTEQLVRTLRAQYAKGRHRNNVCALSRRHGIKRTTVADAVRGVTWKHVK